MILPRTSRRSFLNSAALSLVGAAASRHWPPFAASPGPTKPPLSEFSYGDVSLHSELHERQLHESHDVLMSLSDDSLLKPLRAMAGQPAPGEELGGWYLYKPAFDYRAESWDGFAPACTFGQWVSALARYCAITGDPATRDRVLRLNRLYAKTISPEFYVNNRFPAYCYDKFVCGLIDSHQFASDPDAFAILNHTTDVATPHLPGRAIEHGVQWRPDKHDDSWTWDESYTISENLFLAYQRGAGDRYKSLATAYLDDTYYDPLYQNVNNFSGRHAYSHVNSLCSAMQAWLTLSSDKHLWAVSHAFSFLQAQSFATGGWGPDETLRAPGSDDVFASLSNSHSSFETPCGSYAHFKLTRYLLRVFRESSFGDSMERVMYNTILGARPLQADGRTFYYADCNFDGHKVYRKDRWPCCSGTFPQIAADYRISAYFQEPEGIYVNLYLPSTLTWTQDSARATLTQTTRYPFDSLIQFDLQLSQPTEFALNLRIPQWESGVTSSVNGKRAVDSIHPGFASIRRQWKSGDRVELDIPITTRLEPINARHPDTVALLCGPLVLFAIGEDRPAVSKRQLLAAKKVGPQKWQAATSSTPITLLPFTAIDSERYSTYLKIT